MTDLKQNNPWECGLSLDGQMKAEFGYSAKTPSLMKAKVNAA